ncbi:MAG: Spy/CpxP family protein refolding chaperone [Candidatus Sumerlaeaceae bacterium]
MKTRLLVIQLCFICTIAAAGQQKPGGGRNPGKQDSGMADRQNAMAQKIANSPAMQKLQAARALSLSNAQQTQLTALEQQVKQQMMALRDEFKPRTRSGGESSGAPDRQKMAQQLRPKMEAISKQLSSGIDAILTSEQKAQLAQKLGHPVSAQGLRKTEGRKRDVRGAATLAPVPPPRPAVSAAIAAGTSDLPSSGTQGIANPFAP